MEGRLVRRHFGIKWFQARRASRKAREKLGEDASEEAIMEESTRLIEKGFLSPDYVQSEDVADNDDEDDESFDVRVLPTAFDTPPATETEADMLLGFFLDLGTCQCIDQ